MYYLLYNGFASIFIKLDENHSENESEIRRFSLINMDPKLSDLFMIRLNLNS